MITRVANFGAIAWLALIAACAALAPILASGHALITHLTDPSSGVVLHSATITPTLRPMDIALPIALSLALVAFLIPARSALARAVRAFAVLALGLSIGGILEARTPVRLHTFDPRIHTATPLFHATLAPVPFSPDERIAGTDARDAPPGTSPTQASGRSFILGSDDRGQDVAAQLIHGARTALLVSLGSTLIAMSLGIIAGACMGWFGGWIDGALMRLVESAMSIPVLLVLVVAAGVLPHVVGVTILVIGLVTWTDAARLTRAEFLRLRDADFVAAARAAGASSPRIIALHLVPSALPPVLVEASFALAAAILYEASLSFLGLGPSESASWGRLLASGISADGTPLWWIVVPTGAAIFCTVLSIHALGDTLRRRLAPSV